MGLVAFDTLKFANKLEAEGISRRQAEIFAEAMTDAYKASDLATKQDLKILENVNKQELKILEHKLNTEISNVRTELKEDIASVRAELKEDINKLDNRVSLIGQELGFLRKEVSKTNWLIGVVIAGFIAQFINAIFKFV